MSDNAPPPLYSVRAGGLMRCCLATLDEWSVRVAAGKAPPPKEGDTMQCKYHDGEGMRFRDGAWEWAVPPLEGG
jgi:hypothetical protein